MLRSTAEAIYGLDLEGNCTFCNPAGVRVLGYDTEKELVGKNMHNLIHHTRADGSEYPIDECSIYEAFRRGERIHHDDEVFVRCLGHIRRVRIITSGQRRQEDLQQLFVVCLLFVLGERAISLAELLAGLGVIKFGGLLDQQVVLDAIPL